MKRLGWGIVFISLLAILTSCSDKQNQAIYTINNKSQIIKPEEIEDERVAKIALVGDVIFHLPIIESYKINQVYDFKGCFEDIKELIKENDIAIFNLDGNIDETKKISGYPRFNAPVEVIDALKWTGFNGVVLANNHSLDTEINGLKNTVKNFQSKGLKTIGVGDTKDSRAAMYEVDGIKIGILAYTQFINFHNSGLGYVNMIDLKNIEKDINEIKKKCDFTIVYFHYGKEYEMNVEDEQKELYRQVADMGADLITSSHPHVVRPSENYITKDNRNVPINYSLGNFLTNQNYNNTDIGEVVRFKVTKENNKVKIVDYEIIPVYRLRYIENNRLVVKVVYKENIENYKNKIKQEDYIYALKQINSR
ncbi:MAG: CapA family protein [Clostridiales bacterium]|nr:CapA family protein [Clostridiales bacterium]